MMETRKISSLPPVQAVIVTWNKKKDVIRLLECLKNIDYPKDRLFLLVVDNASTDGTAETLASEYPQVELLRNPENLGGAGGFNAGMRRTLENRPEAEYLWLLDNDVIPETNALKSLVSVMEKHPHAALCGSRIMDTDNPREMIEAGAFIDYRIGDVIRHMPSPEERKNPHAVFRVDYAAACSLLARSSAVRKMGVWHEKFFIYWDDMEWGARFTAAGYEVLAANASVVFHPSWIGRTSDHSAVWRSYYRTRNALCFFSHYHRGWQKRLLLCRMIFRYMGIALDAYTRAASELAKAFEQGIRDFFRSSYGKKTFAPLPRLAQKNPKGIMIFPYPESSDTALFQVRRLKKIFPEAAIWAVIPAEEQAKWQHLFPPETLHLFRQKGKGKISRREKLRIMNFLRKKSWDLLICFATVPRMGAIWGKETARMDAESGQLLALGKNECKEVFRIPFVTVFYMLHALLLPPKKNL
ncbi:MAG: glycosyltransferase family 2 protein [Desulfococcaceae bacterium]|nr:glycosyltransferase family 2 protein [Desulfococcaceae bacterium]